MNTKTIQATTTDGQTISIVVPTDLPSDERADELRALWDEYVQELGGHWKGPVRARVAAWRADDVAEAMAFMGAPVDERIELAEGQVSLFSTGYWAHGF